MMCPMQSQEGPEILLAHRSGKLDAAGAAALESHAEACEACREFLRGQEVVWTALDAWEAPPLSADFDRRLYQRIEQESSWWDVLVRPFRPLVWRRGLPIAATAALLVAAGVLIDRPAPVTPSSSGESAQVESAAPDQSEHAIQDMDLMREFTRAVREAGEPKM